MISNIKAVVFDLDNTLVSSTLNFKDVKKALNCDQNQDLLDFIYALPEPQQTNATEFVLQYELEDAETAFALEGCLDILDTIKKLELHTAIVTRNCRQAADIKVNNNNLNIPLVLTREDHPAKPEPDALYYLAERWGIEAKNILYVGDYIYDIQTAQNASALSCLITYQQPLEFANQADLVVNNLLELRELLVTNLPSVTSSGDDEHKATIPKQHVLF